MKKILICLLTLILLLSLTTACGTKPTSNTGTGTAGTAASGDSTKNSSPNDNANNTAPNSTAQNNTAPNNTNPSNTPQNSSSQSQVTPDNNIPNDAPPMTAKDIAYLPTSDNMELQNISQPDKNQMITSRYIEKNTSTEQAVNDYSDLLKKAGWAVALQYTTNKQPYGVNAQKGKNLAVVLTQQKGKDVLLIIASK